MTEGHDLKNLSMCWHLLEPTARKGSCRNASASTLVRPVGWTGQTGRQKIPAVDLERKLGRDPVGASARRVALGLARPPRTPSDVVETKEERQMTLEELGFGDKSKYETIKDKCI